MGGGNLCIQIAGDALKEGDSCFIKADGDPSNDKPYIAQIKKLDMDPENGGFLVTVRWYYRPEDPGIPGGRKAFHGERELYQSDHRDIIHSATILGRCVVHSLEAYQKLELIRPQDYFSRFQFSVKTKKFYPEEVTVYCSCRMPANPDHAMCACDACPEWYHPNCCGTTLDAVEKLPRWLCPACEQSQRAAAGAGSNSNAIRQPVSDWVPQAGPPAAAANSKQQQQQQQQQVLPPPAAMQLLLPAGLSEAVQLLQQEPLLEALQAQLQQQRRQQHEQQQQLQQHAAQRQQQLQQQLQQQQQQQQQHYACWPGQQAGGSTSGSDFGLSGW